MYQEIIISSSNIQNINAGKLSARFNAAGDRVLRYYIDIQHAELDLHRELSAPDISILQSKVDTLIAQWDKKYAAFVAKQEVAAGKEQAEEMTIEAEAHRDRLRKTLRHTLTIDDTVEWEILKNHRKHVRKPFPKQRPSKPNLERPERLIPPPAPRPREIGFFQKILGQRSRIERQDQATLEEYSKTLARFDNENRLAEERWRKSNQTWDRIQAEWEKERSAWDAEQSAEEKAFLSMQADANAKVDALQASWKNGQPGAIEEHATIVLEASKHDDIVPKQWELKYNSEARMLLVDYRLPTPDEMPTTKSVRFVASTGELKESSISERDKKALFDDLCYQICLRTLHELFEADEPDNLASIAFNGWTKAIDRATGRQVTSIVLSVVANKDEFLAINLEQVEPKACFRSLKGVSAASLVGLTPIAPIVSFEKTDKRFVDAQDVEVADDGTTNLASMDWEDFEHLVRDLFEKEFASRGGEVRVTRSSCDGGVDAVAFDPDPISGGKIVIQAKRYTRTVGVAAVRDLYGTTLNEGATKGILVTTADYGPDAHKFATNKPLSLLSGSHLLHLLEKHGVKAKIDLKEARETMGLG